MDDTNAGSAPPDAAEPASTPAEPAAEATPEPAAEATPEAGDGKPAE